MYLDGTGRQVWLPVVSPRGHSGLYSSGRQQVYWTHRVNGAELRPERMKRGIRRITAFWAHKHGIDLDDAVFLILTRHLNPADGWTRGFLHQQYSQRGKASGTASWSNRRFTLNMTHVDGPGLRRDHGTTQ